MNADAFILVFARSKGFSVMTGDVHFKEFEALVSAVSEVEPKYVIVDRLRLKKGVWENVRRFVEEFYPQYLDEYVGIFVEGGAYYDEFLDKVRGLCEEKGLRCEVNWGGE